MSKRLVGALGVLALLVIAGIVVALTGVGRSGSPSASRRSSAATSKRHQGSATTRPSTTTSTTSSTATTSALPLGSWTLPSPKRYEGVVGVGFPHTTLGAVGHCRPTDAAVRAKRGLLLSLAGALLIGVAIPLVNASYGIA